MNYDFSALEKATKNWHNLPSTKITIQCVKESSGWRVSLEAYPAIPYSDHARDAINWTTEQLKNWPECVQSEFNSWLFTNKKDADKFITLFLLYHEQ